MTSPDEKVTAGLEAIRERAERAREYMQGDPMPSSLDDVPRLLAAVEAVLKLADDWRAVGSPESAEEEALMWQRIESGEALREAVNRELTRKEAGNAGT